MTSIKFTRASFHFLPLTAARVTVALKAAFNEEGVVQPSRAVEPQAKAFLGYQYYAPVPWLPHDYAIDSTKRSYKQAIRKGKKLGKMRLHSPIRGIRFKKSKPTKESVDCLIDSFQGIMVHRLRSWMLSPTTCFIIALLSKKHEDEVLQEIYQSLSGSPRNKILNFQPYIDFIRKELLPEGVQCSDKDLMKFLTTFNHKRPRLELCGALLCPSFQTAYDYPSVIHSLRYEFASMVVPGYTPVPSHIPSQEFMPIMDAEQDVAVVEEQEEGANVAPVTRRARRQLLPVTGPILTKQEQAQAQREDEEADDLRQSMATQKEGEKEVEEEVEQDEDEEQEEEKEKNEEGEEAKAGTSGGKKRKWRDEKLTTRKKHKVETFTMHDNPKVGDKVMTWFHNYPLYAGVVSKVNKNGTVKVRYADEPIKPDTVPSSLVIAFTKANIALDKRLKCDPVERQIADRLIDKITNLGSR